MHFNLVQNSCFWELQEIIHCEKSEVLRSNQFHFFFLSASNLRVKSKYRESLFLLCPWLLQPHVIIKHLLYNIHWFPHY